jgi:hypothetical protein
MQLRPSSSRKPSAPSGGTAPGGEFRRRPLLFKPVLLALSLALTAGLGEISLRLFFRDRFLVFEDERNLLCQYDPQLGWFPIPNARDRLQASRVFGVIHNREGFRGPEPTASNKPAIVFLGDSFVWGYDVDAAERFTDKLQAKHLEWTVYNLGVSGYGTDQEYLLLQNHFDTYKPKVVFLLFCVDNDHEDNCSNVRYGGYYKPYCMVEGKRLRLQGVPVPRGERVWLVDHPRLARSFIVRLLARAYFQWTAPPVLRNPDPTGAILWDLQNYVRSKGAVLVMGLTMSDPKMEEFLRQIKIPYVELTTKLRYKSFGAHWTPEGHSYVCEKVEEFLAQGRFMAEGGSAE